MKKPICLLLAMIVFSGSSLLAGDKQEMSPTKNIMQNAANAPNLSMLVAALKATGLDKTLEGAGPYTLFAPMNEAITDLPKGTWENLMKPENKEQLKKVLEFHILAGKWTTADLKKKIEEGKGVGVVTTLEGEKMRVASHMGMHLMLRDNEDDMGMFNQWDLEQSNGVIHIIDNVMMPKP